MNESQIYVSLKRWLKGKGWILLGGEPPDGTNTIPRIEIKDPHYKGRGSKGSKKVDLISYKLDYFLLTEIKPEYSRSDERKLDDIVDKEKYRKGVAIALKDKRVLPSQASKFSEENMIKSLAFEGTCVKPKNDFLHIYFTLSGKKLVFGDDIKKEIKILF